MRTQQVENIFLLINDNYPFLESITYSIIEDYINCTACPSLEFHLMRTKCVLSTSFGGGRGCLEGHQVVPQAPGDREVQA